MKRLAPVLLAALILTGCASTGAAESSTTPTEEPTPEVEYATESQVASVVAKYEAPWREVIDKSGECRAIWAFSSSPTEDLQGLTCYITEQTAGVTAQVANKNFGELEIPPSMTDLVADTRTILTQIGDIDLAAICGEEGRPADTTECNEALGARNWLYTQLGSQLDAWGPYL